MTSLVPFVVMVTLLVASATAATTASTPDVGPITPAPATYNTSNMRFDYGEALGLSILFYDAQRVGHLPADNPIAWRGDSFLYEVDAEGNDLTGGWFDAGDHVKFNFPQAYTVWDLNWGFLEFREAYEVTGQTNMMCDMIKWPLEYFLKCWQPATNTLYTQVGDADFDHTFWGSPEILTMMRPAWQVNTTCPGSEVAGDFASAFASAYLVFSEICGDDDFAAEMKSAAESVYAFATDYQGSYSAGCYDDSSDYYGSRDYMDELSVAAAWMYKITGEDTYLADAETFYASVSVGSMGLDWSSKGAGASLLLYEATMSEDPYGADLRNFIEERMPGGRFPYSPCGFAYLDTWGSARHASNVAFLALLAAEQGVNVTEYQEWALSQINYLLGDNNYNMSYEVGFGAFSPTIYHHRASSCLEEYLEDCDIMYEGDNPHILFGGLVGGPDDMDHWANNRSDYVQNEVAIDYNAGFQGALAGLVFFAVDDALAEAPPAKC
uniref:cellulase n=1 Tax=Xylophaga rikuzenica TaxID=2028187 RepID=A0A455XAN9_9BIVA|nr:GH9 cellulase [Xylophaga rikuzenica]